MNYQAYRQRRFFGSLDGIRAIAIIGVIWHHTVTKIDWLPMSGRGFLGVDMFFTMSSFLIVTLILREQQSTGTINLKNFYMRRVLRIFPIYYGILFALTLAFGLVARGNDMSQAFFSSLPYYLTYTSNWLRHDPFTFLAIAWSLAAEEQFYIVMPPLQKYGGRWVMPILILFLIVNQLINFELILTDWHANLEILQSTFTPIILGVFVAYLLHDESWYRQLEPIFANKYASIIYAIILIVVINVPVADISGLVRLTIHLLMAGFLISCVMHENHALAPYLAYPILARLGVISYGMYLYHMFARHAGFVLLDRLGANPPFALFLITLLLTIVVAEISFRFYEMPFLRLKKRWAAKYVMSKT